MLWLEALLVGMAGLYMVDAKPLKTRQSLSFDYNNEKVRGVNLGGWLVLEPWITPSLFSSDGSGPFDEYTLCQSLGQAQAQSVLSQHWATWITQSDFNEIASYGLNHVRIPIGYWALIALPGDPYIQGQLAYLDQAVEWARDIGLKVMLDLHGAPGSQNGFDNSGHYGSILWQTGDFVTQTLTAVQNLAERYASDTDVVTAIELLNEPANWALDMSQIKQFYYNGWGNVRSTGQTAVVIHDAFLPIQSYWNGFMNSDSGVNNVILDTHIYQVFSNDQVAMSPCQHIQAACAIGPSVAGTDKWLIVGEWTAAQTDCALWLNGLGKGSRYDGTFPGSTITYGSCQTKSQGTVDGLLEVDKMNLEYYVEAQLDAFEQHTGWIFWAWKNEAAPEWHFQNLTRAGLIPQPLTARKHPGQCQTTTCMIPA